MIRLSQKFFNNAEPWMRVSGFEQPDVSDPIHCCGNLLK